MTSCGVHVTVASGIKSVIFTNIIKSLYNGLKAYYLGVRLRYKTQLTTDFMQHIYRKTGQVKTYNLLEHVVLH